jgi:outer membrane immunogenic protein
LVGNQLLIYGTGGLAYGEVGVSGNTNLSAAIVGGGAFTPTTAGFGASKINVGYSVGGGAEGSYWLPPNWTWKLEYLYLDLGSENTAEPFALPPPGGTVLTAMTGTITTHTHFTDSILRVGLNYKFN